MIREPLKPHHGYHHWPALVLLLLATALATSAQAYHYPWDQGHDTTDWDDPTDPGPCEDGKCDPCSGTGSPVYVSTGHFIWSEIDVSFPGRPELELARTYNSHDPRDGLFGNGWTVDCDTALHKVTETDEAGSLLTAFVLRASNGKRYRYEQAADGTLVSPEGRFDRVEPQANGTVRLIALDGSYRVFSAQGKLVAKTDRNGNTVSYGYDGDGRLAQIADGNSRHLDLLYNNAGHVSAVTDHAGRSWSYDYDDFGNLISVTDPAGGTRRYQYQAFTPPGDGHVYYQLTRVTDASGVIETQVTYSGERVASYTEGENRYAYSYDTTNRRVTKRDSLGNATIYAYSEAGQITAVTDPRNKTLSIAYNDQGRVTQVTDRIGAVTTSTYDAQGRRLTLTNALGETTTYTYEGDNPLPASITSPSGRVSEIAFDTAFNPTRITDPADEVTALSYNAKGDLTAVTDAVGETTEFTPTVAGMLASIIDPLGRRTEFTYDARGNRTSSTNAEGETTQISYDALDRVTAITDPLGNITRFDYDAAGRLTAVTDARGQTTTYRYDPYGRLASRSWPSGRQISYRYRADNRLSEITLEDGTAIIRTYDAAGRLTQENVGDLSTVYGYNDRDDLVSASNELGSVSRSYDAAGRLTSEQVNGQTIISSYNVDGERTEFTAFGDTTSYTRDLRGLITRIDGPAGAFDLAYDAVGRQVSLVRPNGTDTRYQFDAAGQLTQIRHSGGFDRSFSYGLDGAGRITDWSGDGADWHYDYDAAGRLIQASHGSDAFRYAYDPVGNRSSDDGQYNQDNQLIENATHRFRYDARGQLLQKTDKQSGAHVDYGWNARGQLIQVEYYDDASASPPTRTLRYAYGPLGRRWQKTEDGVTEGFVYDGQDRIATLDGNGAVRTQISFGPGIDNPLGSTGALNAYYHANHQGSVMGLTGPAGAVLAEYGYRPFGQATAIPASTNAFAYTGREFEAEDLYYYRARYYDPGIGRFISADPIGFAGGDPNLYAYAGNDPVNYVDPSGTLLDTLIDVGSLAYDLYRLISDNVLGDCDNLGGNLAALGADAAGLLIPGVTGLGPATRAARAADDAIDVAQSTLRGAQNPKVADAAARGRQIHKEYDYGPGFEKEVTLPSGKRADAVNWQTREVVELKPHCCPVNTRIDSIGCLTGPVRYCSDARETLAGWAFSRTG